MNGSYFRKDLVSGDWILVASRLKTKPSFFAKAPRRVQPSKKDCPFENLEKKHQIIFSSDFVKVVKNKFPILTPHKTCPVALPEGPYRRLGGAGFQELVITRDHERSLGHMSENEISLVLDAYRERYLALKGEKCTEYILIFHNNGPSAGATQPHPHSQILALPIIPPDVGRSLAGSRHYFHERKKCVHCVMLKKELSDKKRIIYKNKNFVVFCPYASRVSFEIRLFPLKHNPNFESLSAEERESLAGAMRVIFAKLKNGLADPDYNFFIHTAPAKAWHTKHYHWHLEILPRTAIWGGLELGTGIEVVKVPPEEAAKILRKAAAS